jgi:capsid portal protein
MSKIDYVRLEQDLRELEFLPLRKDISNAFREVYGVPPEALGIIENSNRATIEHALYIMAALVAVPRLERLCRMWEKFLVPLFDDRLVLVYNDPTPRNKEQQFAAIKMSGENSRD